VLWLAGGLGSRWTSVAAGGKVRHVRSMVLNPYRMLPMIKGGWHEWNIRAAV
jgi:hypothetical protein